MNGRFRADDLCDAKTAVARCIILETCFGLSAWFVREARPGRLSGLRALMRLKRKVEDDNRPAALQED